ncbi:MAG: hypothetical protein K0Q72_220 [Armatimonadetes bacterium]|jgi:hypothetical protein|nr:hypothetical protein [Armatimonadota bacterium]
MSAVPHPARVAHYLVHGVRIEIRMDDPLIEEALQYRLGMFACDPAPDADVLFEYQRLPESEVLAIQPPAGEAVRVIARTPTAEVLYDGSEDLLYIAYGRLMKAAWNGRQSVCRVRYAEAELLNLWRLTHPMFTLPFVDCMKRHRRYNIHAASICVDGRGVVFAGGSGYGKSTLTIALVRAGLGFMGDDQVFLCPEDGRILFRAFPDEIDVTENTARMFPELAPVLEASTRPDWPKRQVRVPETYGTGYVFECEPAAVVLPRIAHADQTRVEPLGRDEAFFELVSHVAFTHTEASQAHVDAIGALLRQVPCYRMHTGRDFDALPELVRGLAAGAG